MRCPGFRGLGRMNTMDATYVSNKLFPFFQNRLLHKNRPEYKKLIEWLALDDINEDPMDILIGTGGLRSTDSFELIPQPNIQNNKLSLNFFVRGLRYLPDGAISFIDQLEKGSTLLLMKDFQNPTDHKAFALRISSKPVIIGYLPKYFCSGIHNLIGNNESPEVKVVKINKDAPLDMRCLCNASASIPEKFNLIDDTEDFLPWELVRIGVRLQLRICTRASTPLRTTRPWRARSKSASTCARSAWG